MAPNIPVEFRGLSEQRLPIPQHRRLAIAIFPCSDSRIATGRLIRLDGIAVDYACTGTMVGEEQRRQEEAALLRQH